MLNTCKSISNNNNNNNNNNWYKIHSDWWWIQCNWFFIYSDINQCCLACCSLFKSFWSDLFRDFSCSSSLASLSIYKSMNNASQQQYKVHAMYMLAIARVLNYVLLAIVELQKLLTLENAQLIVWHEKYWYLLLVIIVSYHLSFLQSVPVAHASLKLWDMKVCTVSTCASNLSKWPLEIIAKHFNNKWKEITKKFKIL